MYFDTDSYQLQLSELNRLDDFLKNKELKFTKVIGYCDYRASNGYNDTLAFNRANFVNGIIEKVTNQKQIAIESKGENFEQNSDLALNRKVEIIVKAKPPKPIVETKKEIPVETKKKNVSELLKGELKIGDKTVEVASVEKEKGSVISCLFHQYSTPQHFP